MSEYDSDIEEEEPRPVLPAPAASWSWTPARIAYVAGGIAGLGFLVWFIMDFSSAKAAHLAKVAANATA